MAFTGTEAGGREALPRGFLWGAVKAGIKASGSLDLAAAICPKGAHAAAMFTRNLVVAAPVIVGRRHLDASGGRVAALLVNAGNANCATGGAGVQACTQTCTAAAEAFGCIFDEVFPSSTGIIGVPLPTELILNALPALRTQLGATAEHLHAFASAILTTDTKKKVAHATVDAGADGEIRILGIAKGAGMIHPQLGSAHIKAPAHATMLVYLFTDASATPPQLKEALEPIVERTFNSISIDGDTSTNDTVLLLSSGESGITLEGPVYTAFSDALHLVCRSLAHEIVDDGEGVGHVITLQVNGAETEAEAKQVAKALAHSPLNKTAWASADPNWGRLLAAAGASGVRFDPARICVLIGEQVVFENGSRAISFDRDLAHTTMLQREYTITVELGEGESSCTFLTCDLTEEYVRINAEYST